MNSLIGIKLGKKIKEYRKRRGITQEQLAELVKTSYKYVQRLEGKTPPDVRLTTVEKLAKAFRVSISKLVDFK